MAKMWDGIMILDLKKPFGLDIYISNNVPIGIIKDSIVQVFGLSANNIWDGDAVVIGEMLEHGVPDAWAVLWATGDADFPVKVDIEVNEGDNPRLVLGELSRTLQSEIAIPDDESENPYALVVFMPDGTTKPSFMKAA